MPSKSGLIGVWHKDNLYLGTNTVGNGKHPPNKYWFVNEKYKDVEQGADVSGPILALLGLFFSNATRIKGQQFILLIK
jgi:hypothetical protein